ncbi:MAG: hypothetical protein WCD69_12315 [Xanthobacteraceae bacterium]
MLGGNLRPSSTPQAASDHRHGSDPVLARMRRFNIPLTRQNYLDLAHMGKVPDPLGAEEEAELLPEMVPTPLQSLLN